LSEREAIEVARQVASALSAAHEVGVVHRDIKPANVMVSRSGDGVVARVVDFGLAWVQEDIAAAGRLTRADLVVGTPEYMSPEQVLRRPVGPATDLYSLGVLLYELLSGRTPFASRETALHIALAHVDAEVPPLPPEVSPALSALVRSLLEKDPARRPASAGVLASALSALRPSGPRAIEPRSLAVLAVSTREGAIEPWLSWVASQCDRAGASVAQVIDHALLLHCPGAESAVRLALSLGERLAVGVDFGRADVGDTGALLGDAVTRALEFGRAVESIGALVSKRAHDECGFGLRARLVPVEASAGRDEPLFRPSSAGAAGAAPAPERPASSSDDVQILDALTRVGRRQ
jgi:hypothetical protein